MQSHAFARVSFLLLLCFGAVALTQSLTDAQKIDQAIALVKSVQGLTDTGLTNQKNILTRLETLKGQFVVVEPTPDPIPPPPPPVYVTQSVFDALVERVAKLEGAAPAPTPTPEPIPTPTPVPTPTPEPVLVPPGDHGYFQMLTARADHWKSYSLRDPKQLTYKNLGGFSDHNSTSFPNTLYVAYDATADAAKVVIPPFRQAEREHVLSAPIDAAQLSFTLTDIPSASIFWNGGKNRRIRIGSEIMGIEALPDNVTNTLTVTARGMDGTAAAPHAAGAAVEFNNNSLPSQVILPLGTVDGSAYLFTWDGYWTDSYLNSGLSNHKAFQFASDGVWFEPQTGFDGARKVGFSQATDVAVVTARSYNLLGGVADYALTDGNRIGPNVTASNYLLPRLAMPTIAPNRWTRFWVRLEQRANDYDLVSLWFADVVTEPTLVYDRLPLSVRSKTGAVDAFWLEFNTSTDGYTRGAGQRDFVSYVKNVAALRGPLSADWSALMVKPEGK